MNTENKKGFSPAALIVELHGLVTDHLDSFKPALEDSEKCGMYAMFGVHIIAHAGALIRDGGELLNKSIESVHKIYNLLIEEKQKMENQ